MKANWLAGLAIGALLAVTAQARDGGAVAAATQAGAEARTAVVLADGWRFIQGDPAGAAQPAFDDAAWQPVRVPHTWNRIGYYEPRVGVGPNTAGTVAKYQGVGWYRLRFPSPARASGEKVWLEFDAASRIAEVWVNGVRLGSHAGGFSRFRFDATSALRPGASNIVAVRVDNSAPVAGSATADVLPLSGDFFVRGGLYRPVRLIVTNPLHIDLLDHGGPGVYATTTSISAGLAQVRVRTRLANDTGRVANGAVVARLVDAQGRVAAQARAVFRLPMAQVSEQQQDLAVARPHLWQGTADPYLYRLIVDVVDGRGRVVDTVAQPFGIRQVSIDPQRGFLLNGKVLALHGVGLHQDTETSDWAMSEADIARTFATIRDMGANTIRLTHYQHGETIHTLADRYGLVLWDEIPLVTQWTQGEAINPTTALVGNAQQQLAELIRQNFNHPAVAFWGVANEVDFGPNRPDFLGKPPAAIADPKALVRLLDQQARQDDPSRPTVMAACCQGDPAAPDIVGLTQATAVNRYYGWYYGKPAGIGPYLDGLHAKYPHQPLALSEYGAGGALTYQTDDPAGGPADIAGPRLPEGYQAWVHEQTWPLLRDRPWLFGTWLWNAFDFGSTVRREGDSVDVNTKGLVTYDGTIHKDAFYYYRANWSAAPTVHITGRRYTQRAYPVTEVRVYSNAPRTELALNGRSLGGKTDCPNRVCVWSGVALAAGANVLTATGQFATGAVADRIEWQLAGAQAGAFRIDAGALVAAHAPDAVFGSDAFFSGGTARSVDVFARGRAPVRPEIAGTRNRDLAATFRAGAFSYRIPTGPGAFTVSLTFVEPAEQPGSRIFDVAANGQTLLKGFDIAGAAGGPLVEVTRSFPVTATDGVVTIDFVPVKGEAVVSAITVLPRR